MFKQLNLLLISYMIILPFIFASYSQARPPKPGPNFVWVKPHDTSNGTSIPGHWKYVESAKKEKVWVPGHYSPNGKWLSGHWKSLSPSKKGSAWVPGHYGSKGRWVPGHWYKSIR